MSRVARMSVDGGALLVHLLAKLLLSEIRDVDPSRVHIQSYRQLGVQCGLRPGK